LFGVLTTTATRLSTGTMETAKEKRTTATEEGESTDDDDLTSLAWLTDVRPPVLPTVVVDQGGQHEKRGKKARSVKVPQMAAATAASSPSSASPVKKTKPQPSPRTNAAQLAAKFSKLAADCSVDYKNNSVSRPPFSYAALICLAMVNAGDAGGLVSLSQIYRWIKEHFAFYRNGDKSWQVSQSV